MNAHLDFLLSPIYDRDALAPEHLADLGKSGLTHATIQRQKIRSIPPNMIPQLLGFDLPATRSAYLLPFPDPRGGWMDHVRLKIFPALEDRNGHAVRYLQPKGSGVRLFFPLSTLTEAMHGPAAVWLVEGEKKSLAVAQLGLPAVGFAGIEGWHRKGERALIEDFAFLNLAGRLVELVPDGDLHTNPDVARGTRRFADALMERGAQVRIVVLPAEITA